MFCPECGAEYVEGFKQCSDCHVPLVGSMPSAPSSASDSSAEPVAVFSSDSAEAIAIAKSILISAQVDFGVRGEGVQDLFGYGRFPEGRSLLMGPIQILVPAEDAQDAVALLQDVDRSPAFEPALSDDSGYPPDGWALLRTMGKWASRAIVAGFALELLYGLLSAVFDR